MIRKLFHVLGRTAISFLLGVESPPPITDEQCIIAANHNSHIDVMILFRLFSISRVNRVRTIAAKDYFAEGIKGFFAEKIFNTVLIERGASARKTFEMIKEQLNAGYSLIIFPEGTRGLPGVMNEFKSGVGQIAIDFPGIPIYPVCLSGAEKSLPKGTRVPVPFNIKMKVLDPVYGKDYLSLPSKEGRGKITAEIETRIRSQA